MKPIPIEQESLVSDERFLRNPGSLLDPGMDLIAPDAVPRLL